MNDERDPTTAIIQRLDDLTDLFARRLADDRARRAAVEELGEQLRRTELGPFRQYLQPFVHGLAFVVDRLDRYTGPDQTFAASIRDELFDLLERHGVRQVPTTGPFNPAWHEAIDTCEDPGSARGTLTAVARRGFIHDSWVFRPAQVIVNTISDSVPDHDVAQHTSAAE